jgi:hypothetical protein
MQRWEYLSVQIEYHTLVTPDPQRNMVAEGWGSQETGPIGGIDDVLNHYGEDGWELVGLIAQAWVNSSTGLSEGTPRTAVSEYRASFKRARS